MNSISYHLSEPETALNESRPQHCLPELHHSTVGIVHVGCGIGQLFAARNGEIPARMQRFAFDLDETAIAFASRRWPSLAHFAVARAEALPLPAHCVDTYVSRVALPYTDLRAALREAARVLIPGGRLWVARHPSRMMLRELGRSLRARRWRSATGRAVTFVNGLILLLTGRQLRLFGVQETWQSPARIVAMLTETGFEETRVALTPHHFLVDALPTGRHAP